MGRRQASALEILKPCLEQPGAALSALICAEHQLAQTPRGPVLTSLRSLTAAAGGIVYPLLPSLFQGCQTNGT